MNSDIHYYDFSFHLESMDELDSEIAKIRKTLPIGDNIIRFQIKKSLLTKSYNDNEFVKFSHSYPVPMAKCLESSIYLFFRICG